MEAPITARAVRAPDSVDFRIFCNHLSQIIRGTVGDKNTSLLEYQDFTFGRLLIEEWVNRHACHDTTLTAVMSELIQGNVLREIAPDTFQVTLEAIEQYRLALQS